MQIKTTVRYHLVPIRMAIKKSKRNTGKDVEEKDSSLCIAGETENWYSHCGKQFGDLSKN